MQKTLLAIAALALPALTALAQSETTATFENLPFETDAAYEDGHHMEDGAFVDGGLRFENASYDYEYAGHSYYITGGFMYSRSQQTTFASATYDVDQFNNPTGHGAGGSDVFAVYFSSYQNPGVTAAGGTFFEPKSVRVTNDVYTLSSVLHGDSYARQFTESDEFVLRVHGIDGEGNETGVVEVPLASGGYVAFTWIEVDLTTLGRVARLTFDFTSTDASDYGINTPAYFCMDDLVVTLTDEPVTALAKVAQPARPTSIHALDGTRHAAPARGVNVVTFADGKVQKVVVK